jgi:hypothetical protein
LGFGEFDLHQLGSSVSVVNEVDPSVEQLLGTRNLLQNTFGQLHLRGVRAASVRCAWRHHGEPAFGGGEGGVGLDLKAEHIGAEPLGLVLFHKKPLSPIRTVPSFSVVRSSW